MRLIIEHDTYYHYETASSQLIQAVRMTPAPHAGQKVISWMVSGSDDQSLAGYRDGFGNWVQFHKPNLAANEVCLKVKGEIETTETNAVITGSSELLPLEFYRNSSAYTLPDDSIRDLALTSRGNDTLGTLHHLMQQIRAAVDYRVDTTSVENTAAQALALGSGVCQDHAHVMISAARILDIPARYVSGYLWIETEQNHAASHAWMEAYVAGLGWVGFDPANAICPGEGYVRIAIGRDYADAAPVRGVRTGGGTESLDVRVSVRAIQQ
jgi:transglutaminase-like putative cysteine protease